MVPKLLEGAIYFAPTKLVERDVLDDLDDSSAQLCHHSGWLSHHMDLVLCILLLNIANMV